MKSNQTGYFNLILGVLFALPAIVLAAPPTTSPYNTDKVNSYVQDQVSKDMEELNLFLCLVSAMAPDQMVNLGSYNAMVDINACKPNTQGSQQGGGSGGGGQNNQNSSVNYISVLVEATRESNTKPMLTKIWVDNLSETDNGVTRTFNVRMYASATQAPSATSPYGTFRLDFCKEYPDDANGITTCTDHIGYISASKSGLSFFTKDNKFDLTNGEYYDEFALQLSSSSTTSKGSGIVIKTNTNSSTGLPTTSAVVFANNADYFYRNAGDNPQCFDRAESKAQESVWRYGLYNTSTGARISRESGFPIEYSTGGQTYYGFISYWGFQMPVDVPDNSPVVKPDFSTYPPTPINYTLQRTGGKLTKYTTNFKKLSDYNKLPFDFYPYNDVTAPSSGGIVMNQWNSYRIYWDKDANGGAGQFFVHSYYDNILGRYVENTPPLAVDNGSMAASMTYYGSDYGLYGWSESTGSFIIKGAEFLNLPTSLSNTKIISNSQDVVYPTQFANTEFSSGIVCIADCLTRSSIDSYNTAYNAGNYYATAFARPSNEYSYLNVGSTYTYTSTQHTYTLNYISASNSGSITDVATPYVQYYDGASWSYPATTPVTTPNAYTLSSMFYTLDPATGNLVDSTNSQVNQTGTNGLWGNGRFVSKADWDYIIGQKCTGYPTSNCSAIITDADIDLLADDIAGHPNGYSYYQWQTGSSTWDQLTYLEDSSGSRVRLYPPLQVAYQVPNQSKYGSYKNTKLNLTYGEFGNLWGIPYNCIDMRSNTACTYAPIGTETDYWSYYRWVPQFSIPFNTTDGKVITEFNQGEIADTIGYVAKDTQFLVKGLEKEARLYKVGPSICSVQQLGTNIVVDKLPSDTQWDDPVINTGDKPTPTNNAPRVIHGVVQY